MGETNKTHPGIHSIIEDQHIQAVIFDLDGTILDNNSFHLESWLKYLESKNIKISQEDFNQYMSGRTNKDAIEYIFQRKMSDEEILKYTLEKEAVYRELYAPQLKPVKGFLKLLGYLKEKRIKMAIATSGIQPNIDFMFEHLPVKEYFAEIVNSAHIKNGKPDPEIYLLTAKKLKIEPTKCLVFEDSVPGIISAKSAGMMVIALTTTQLSHELAMADWVINDFEDLF